MGKRKLYLKKYRCYRTVIKVDTIVFDKTGTLTSNNNQQIKYVGENLTKEDLIAVKNIVRGSNHPLSRRLYLILPNVSIEKPANYQEIAGKGIEGYFKENI